MPKIIIHNKDLSDLEAVNLVSQVILGGLASDNNTQYCYITTFKEKFGTKTFTVHCERRNDTHTFKVWTNDNQE